jgi:predicted PurR-regulated permease PerM
LSPLVTILAIMIGTRLAGISGGVLSIPLVIALREILKTTVGQTNAKN